MLKQKPENELPVIGESFGGGYYAGLVMIDGQRFALIVAPREEGETIHAPWNNTGNAIDGAISYCDGMADTQAMAAAGSGLAEWAQALEIGGHADWYLPSQDELEILYRHFKPTQQENLCFARSGINLSAVEPTRPYIPEHPKQTPLSPFQEGGAEAFLESWYWSSTQSAFLSYDAWAQDFYGGNQSTLREDYRLRARAVRRLAI